MSRRGGCGSKYRIRTHRHYLWSRRTSPRRRRGIIVDHPAVHREATLSRLRDCIAAGIQPFVLSRFMGHANTNVTLGVYAHLFQDDHADAMAALGALGTSQSANVVPMRAG